MKPLPSLLTLALLLSALGCSANDDRAESYLRFLNASPAIDSLDTRVSGRISVSRLAYGEAKSDTVQAGTRRVELRREREGNLVAVTINVRMEEDRHYTLIVAGLLTSLQPILLEDDLSPPPSGQARVRIVHGASTAGLVDLYITSSEADIATETPDFSDAAFGQNTGAVMLPAGSHRLRVTRAGTKTVVIDRTLTLEAGDRLTLTAVEPSNDGGFGLLVISDMTR